MVKGKRVPVPKVTNNSALNILLASEFGDQVKNLIGDDLHEFCDLESVGSSSPSDWENDLRDEMGMSNEQKIVKKTRERSNSIYELFPVMGSNVEERRPVSPPHVASPSREEQYRLDDEETSKYEEPLFKGSRKSSRPHSAASRPSSVDVAAKAAAVSARLEKVESQKAALLKKDSSTPSLARSTSKKLPDMAASKLDSRRSSLADGTKLVPSASAATLPTKPMRRTSSVTALPAAPGAVAARQPSSSSVTSSAREDTSRPASNLGPSGSRRPSLASSASSVNVRAEKPAEKPLEKVDPTSNAKRLLSTYGAVDTAKTVMTKKFVAPVTPLAAQMLVKTASTVLKKK